MMGVFDESIWGHIPSFIKAFHAMLARGVRDGTALGERLANLYVGYLKYIVKVCVSLGCLGVLCWIVINLTENRGGLLFMLFTLFGACVAVILLWGVSGARPTSVLWHATAAGLGAGSIAIQAALVAAGEQGAARSLVYVTLIGLPSIAIMVTLFPIGVAVDSFKRLYPELYATAANIARIAILAVIWVGVNALWLQISPLGSHPIAPLIMAPLSMLAFALVGLRLIPISPDRFFGWPMLVGALLIHIFLFVATSMPDFTAWVVRRGSTLNDRFIETPTPVTFRSSKDIDFVDLKGRPKICFAQRDDGGFDFWYSRSENLFAPDARQYQLADTEEERARIKKWVDDEELKRRAEEQATRRQEAVQQAEREAKRVQDDEVARARRLEDEKARIKAAAEERQKAETERLASYVIAVPKQPVDCIVFCRDPAGVPAFEPTSLIVARLSAMGVTATGDVFSKAYICPEGFDKAFSGGGGQDLKAMGMGSVTRRILLASAGNGKSTSSKSVAGMKTHSTTMTLALIDATDGSVLSRLVLGDITGAGVSELSARTAFYERFADAVASNEALLESFRGSTDE